jgi:hypothetical protein
MYAFDEEQGGAGVPEVAEPYVGQPGERLGGSAGGATVPYLPARTYAMNRTTVAPAGSSRTAKHGAVVVIDVERHCVGDGNGTTTPHIPFSPTF